MEINLLLRLIIAHLLTDFVLQPKGWIADRKRRHGRSTKLYWHAIITAAVAYAFSGLYQNWLIPTVILITHLLIDYFKSKATRERVAYFILDQLAHLLVIVLLWLFIEDGWKPFALSIQPLTQSTSFWIIVAGYLFVSWPLGIFIGKATQKWREQIYRENEKSVDVLTKERQDTEEQALGLANAGKWIGICERILILTFILMQQYTAIGFLMTAKSILRFSEKETHTQLKTEYILVGTLVSFALAAMVGVAMNQLLYAIT